MLEALRPFSLRTPVDRFLHFALVALPTATTIGVVVLLVSNRVRVSDAIFLAALPWACLVAALRPDWLLLGFIGMPASVTADIQPRRVSALVGLGLVMLLVTRRRFSLGWRTGLMALLIINVAGYMFRALVGTDAIAVNERTMMSLTLYILLALLAFNLAVLEELDGGRLATALVIGVVSTLLVGLAGHGGSWFHGGPSIITRGYLGSLASAALGVSFARLLIAEDVPGRRWNLLMTGVLLWLTIASKVRAVWIAAAITVGLLALRLGRRGYVLILAIAIALALLTTTVRQEIARDESGDIVAEIQSGEIATGRWKLWTALWERAQPALPWGNGFGYIWSLSSEDLLGEPGQFQHEESGVVPPHNDFLYLLVEFGVPGLLLLVVFWVGLFRAASLGTGSADPLLRRSVWLLLGAMVTGLTVALIDDVFAIRPLAERFFPVAGFVFGLSEVERARRREDSISESVPVSTQAPSAPVA